MGASGSTLHPNVVQHLSEETKFTKKEVRMLHRCFRHATAKKAHLSREAFVELFWKAFPEANGVLFANHAFRLYDLDNDGQIDFSDFVLLLNTQLKGNRGEKLELLFKLYDVDGNQHISRHDVKEIIEQLHSLNSGFVPKEHVASPEIITNSIFAKIGGDVMEPRTFYQRAQESPTMRELLQGSSHALYQHLLFGEFGSDRPSRTIG